MTKPIQYNTLQVYAKFDPTRTTSLSNAFAADMKKRFDALIKLIVKAIEEDDVFGLTQTKIGINATSPPRASFAFPRSQDKMSKFMAWLDTQIQSGILQVTELSQVGTSVNGAWTNKYIQDSYKRGVQRARYEIGGTGLNIPTIEMTGGIAMSMATPFHMDRLGLLYTRTFSDLKGITSQMDTQISRVLTQGIADGDNPKLLARKLKATINGTGAGELGLTDTLGRFIPAARRAEMIARTEIIRAHHQATIQEYKNWGLEGVKVQGEWKTANDGRVCSQCAELEGKIFTLSEIENKIPLHPNCRCIALPYIEDLQKYLPGAVEEEIKPVKQISTPIVKAIEKELPKTQFDIDKNYASEVIEKSLPKGADYSYVGFSDTNGKSMYFKATHPDSTKEVKIRFSDHGISNPERLANEVLFNWKLENEANTIYQKNQIGYLLNLPGYTYKKVMRKITTEVTEMNIRGRKIVGEYIKPPPTGSKLPPSKRFIVEDELEVWTYIKE